jgi:hypothetical protein
VQDRAVLKEKTQNSAQTIGVDAHGIANEKTISKAEENCRGGKAPQ